LLNTHNWFARKTPHDYRKKIHPERSDWLTVHGPSIRFVKRGAAIRPTRAEIGIPWDRLIEEERGELLEKESIEAISITSIDKELTCEYFLGKFRNLYDFNVLQSVFCEEYNV